MQFEGYRRSAPVVNLTPLIDIIFLLLVFFMLTSHFVRDEALDVSLPEAQHAETRTAVSQGVEVVLAAGGALSLNGEPVAMGELVERLGALLATTSPRLVRIRGDQAANLQEAVAILDAARAAGAESVELLTEAR